MPENSVDQFIKEMEQQHRSAGTVGNARYDVFRDGRLLIAALDRLISDRLKVRA